jgi:SHS2 domain-containing protein
MTKRESICESPDHTVQFSIEGDCKSNLLYNLLDEVLFKFCTPPFLATSRIELTKIKGNSEDSLISYLVTCYGEPFDRNRHPCETEVKAITKSNILVTESESFVILDI